MSLASEEYDIEEIEESDDDVEAVSVAMMAKPVKRRRLAGKQRIWSPELLFAAPAVTLCLAATMCGVSEAMLYRLLCCGLPPLMFHLLKAIKYRRDFSLTEHLDFVEWFAGSQCVSSYLSDFLSGAAVDCLYDPIYGNIMTFEGFVQAVVMALRLRGCSAFQFFGTVCSSWIWLVRSCTKRTPENPLGDRDNAFTEHGNVMVARCCLLKLIGWAKGCYFMLEQPSSTLMKCHPRIEQVIAITGAQIVNTCMGGFGGPTKKRTLLLTDVPWGSKLARSGKGHRGSGEKLAHVDELGRVTGKRSALKNSQAYPAGFGREVASLHVEHMQDMGGFTSYGEIRQVFKPDVWADAELEEVARSIGVASDIAVYPWQ